jgi:phage shock protein C
MDTTKKTLKRIPEHGQIAGVCAGFADYFDLDVTLMRVIFVILAFATGGFIVIVYIVLAIILPVDEKDKVSKNTAAKTSGMASVTEKVENLSHEIQANRGVDKVRNYLGIGLLILGVWLLLGQFFPDFLEFRWDYVWPLLLVLAGLLIITKKGK